MDEGTAREHDSISGDVEPAGTGEWLTLKEAGARLGIDPKAVYRRYKRSKLQGKKAPHASHLLVWLPGEHGHLEAGTGEQDQEGDPGHLAVPETGERYIVFLETAVLRAVTPLTETIKGQQAQIEGLIRENERLRNEREQRARDEERRPWWYSLRWW